MNNDKNMHKHCDADIVRLGRENKQFKTELAELRGGFDALDREQCRQLLEFFMYRLGFPRRQELAATLPHAYNAWCGQEIVKVVSVHDPDIVWRVPIREREESPK